MSLNEDVEIEDYCIVTLRNFEFSDTTNFISSGNEADFAILDVDILNTTVSRQNFLAQCKATAVFDEKYTYEGRGARNELKLSFAPVEPMYQGHYRFTFELPNAVVKSTKPLKIIITLDGHVCTYNVRK